MNWLINIIADLICRWFPAEISQQEQYWIDVRGAVPKAKK